MMAVKKKKAKKPVKKKVVKKKPAPKKAKAKKAARPKKASVSKKPAAKKPSPKKGVAAFPKPILSKAAAVGYQKAKNEIKIGEVEDYFSHIGVIAVNLLEPLGAGNNIHVRGHTTDLTQRVESMQIDHVSVEQAKRGDAVGIKVDEKCRKGDEVFRVDFGR